MANFPQIVADFTLFGVMRKHEMTNQKKITKTKTVIKTRTTKQTKTITQTKTDQGSQVPEFHHCSLVTHCIGDSNL